MLHEFYILTRSLDYIPVGRWLAHNRIKHEVHLNRTRFWIDEGPLLTEFLLRWQDSCPPVDPLEDRTTGIINIVK